MTNEERDRIQEKLRELGSASASTLAGECGLPLGVVQHALSALARTRAVRVVGQDRVGEDLFGPSR